MYMSYKDQIFGTLLWSYTVYCSRLCRVAVVSAATNHVTSWSKMAPVLCSACLTARVCCPMTSSVNSSYLWGINVFHDVICVFMRCYIWFNAFWCASAVQCAKYLLNVVFFPSRTFAIYWCTFCVIFCLFDDVTQGGWQYVASDVHRRAKRQNAAIDSTTTSQQRALPGNGTTAGRGGGVWED